MLQRYESEAYVEQNGMEMGVLEMRFYCFSPSDRDVPVIPLTPLPSGNGLQILWTVRS